MLVAFSIPALGLLFLQNQQVQTKLSQYLAKTISENLNTKITLSEVNFSFFKRFQVRDLYVEDLYGDTLLYSEVTKIRIRQFKPDKHRIHIKSIVLENANVNFVIDSSNVLNLTMITDRLKNPHIPPEKKLNLLISDIKLDNSRFGLSRMNMRPKTYGVNFTDLDVDIEKIHVTNLTFNEDTVDMKVNYLIGTEKSGFDMQTVSFDMQIGKNHMQFTEVDIKTPVSEATLPIVGFEFDNFKQFKTFSEYINLDIVSENSDLMGSDLAYFVPILKNYKERFTFTGQVKGKISDLKGKNLSLIYNEESYLDLDFVMIGLPDIENTFLDFNFKNFKTNLEELNSIFMATDISMLNENEILNKFGSIEYQGGFTGFPDNFVTFGFLSTDVGDMILDLSFRPDSSKNIGFRGQLQCDDLLLGRLIEQEENVGNLDMNIFAEGLFKNNEFRAQLNGVIDTLEFFQYAYSNINLDGVFENKTFDGKFSIADPNIRMEFEGLMDFSSEIPVYNFVADVARARPYYLNLRDDDPGYFASFLLETNLTGKTLDGLNGDLKLINSLFERTGFSIQMYNLSLSAHNAPDTSFLLLRSDLLDADIYGLYKITELPKSFSNLLDHYINIDPDTPKGIDSINHFTYKIDFKRVEPVLDFFFPTFQIGDNSSINGKYEPSNQHLYADGHFNSLGIGASKWNNLYINVDLDSSMLRADIESDSINFGDFTLGNQFSTLRVKNDTMRLNTSWNNISDSIYRGEVDLAGFFKYTDEGTRQFHVSVNKSDIVVNNDIWELYPSKLMLSKMEYSFDRFLIKSGEKFILADGTYSKNGENELKISMNDLNLSQGTSILDSPIDFDGQISGDILLRNENSYNYVLSDLNIENLTINKVLYGNTKAIARWDDEYGGIQVDASSRINNFETINISGDYIPKSGVINFDVNLNNANLSTLNPFALKVATDLSGLCSVQLTVDGTIKKPEFNGSVFFHGGSGVINFLNTRYTFNDDVRIYRNNFYFDDFKVLDRFNNEASLNGSITNSYFKDLRLNLDIQANNVEVINTTTVDNEVFYGNVFSTGRVGITGPTDKIKFKIDARTDRNTSFNLPLYNPSEVQTIDFVTFKQTSEDTDNDNDNPISKIRGIVLEMDLEITPDAEVQLIFDPKVGDIIKASGKGFLQINLDENGRFQMFGDVELQKGDYLFTLQNVINKRFEINPGGKIVFNGSPTNANIDLNAIYKLTAAPYNLSPEGDASENLNLKKRIPVECQLTLLGELANPTIKPGINMPTAEPETKNLLENSTSTEEELMKQFLALLVINNFYSVTGFDLNSAAGGSSNIAGVTASELLSNQLSNWLSQISDDFDIGINYRPGDEVTQNEVEVALSTQLLDDRVRISGNVRGHTTSPTTGAENNANIAGDFIVEFRVTDNVSVKAFNRARDELVYQTSPYKQGVGISFREEFDSFNGLMNKYKEGLSKRKQKKKAKKSQKQEDAISNREDEEDSTN